MMKAAALWLLAAACSDESVVRVEVAGGDWCARYCIDRLVVDLTIGEQRRSKDQAGCESVTFDEIVPPATVKIAIRGLDAGGTVVVEGESQEVSIEKGQEMVAPEVELTVVAEPPVIRQVQVDHPTCAGLALLGGGFGTGAGDSLVSLDGRVATPSQWRDDFVCLEGAAGGGDLVVRGCGIDSRTFRVPSYTCLCQGRDLDLALPSAADACDPRLTSSARVRGAQTIAAGLSCGVRAGLSIVRFDTDICAPRPSLAWFDTLGSPLDLDADETVVWAAMGDAGLRSHDLVAEAGGFDAVNPSRVAVEGDRFLLIDIPVVGQGQIVPLARDGQTGVLTPTARDTVEYLDVAVSDACIVVGALEGSNGVLFSARIDRPLFFDELDAGACPGASSIAVSERWVATLCQSDPTAVTMVAIDGECALSEDTRRSVRIQGSSLVSVAIDGGSVVALDQTFGLRVIDPISGARGPDIALPGSPSTILAQLDDILVVMRTPDVPSSRGSVRLLSSLRQGTPCR
jgi:hypothetical protein